MVQPGCNTVVFLPPSAGSCFASHITLLPLTCTSRLFFAHRRCVQHGAAGLEASTGGRSSPSIARPLPPTTLVVFPQKLFSAHCGQRGDEAGLEAARQRGTALKVRELNAKLDALAAAAGGPARLFVGSTSLPSTKGRSWRAAVGVPSCVVDCSSPVWPLCAAFYPPLPPNPTGCALPLALPSTHPRRRLPSAGCAD